MAMVTGELSKEEIQRKTERDLRTLYIRFKSSDTAPTSEKEIKALESSIKDVRVPRQGKLKEGKRIRYAFVEFSSEKVCESMKDKLAANPDFFVDFVGVKSNSKGGPKSKYKCSLINNKLNDILKTEIRKILLFCLKCFEIYFQNIFFIDVVFL